MKKKQLLGFSIVAAFLLLSCQTYNKEEEAAFIKSLVGHGWRQVEGYDMKRDGTFETTNYVPIQIGGTAPYYEFKEDKVIYYYATFPEGWNYVEAHWHYDGKKHLLQLEGPLHHHFKVDSFDSISFKGLGTLGIIEGGPYYRYMIFSRLSDEEMRELRQKSGYKNIE